MVIFDNVNKTVLAVAHAHIPPSPLAPGGRGNGGEGDLQASYRAACDAVDRLVERLQRGAAGLQLTDIDADRRSPVSLAYRSNFTPEGFEAGESPGDGRIKAPGGVFGTRGLLTRRVW